MVSPIDFLSLGYFSCGLIFWACSLVAAWVGDRFGKWLMAGGGLQMSALALVLFEMAGDHYKRAGFVFVFRTSRWLLAGLARSIALAHNADLYLRTPRETPRPRKRSKIASSSGHSGQ